MSRRFRVTQPGVRAAFGAALLFGASTPLAKILLRSVESVGVGRFAVFGLGNRTY
jgi:hypothetical protein